MFCPNYEVVRTWTDANGNGHGPPAMVCYRLRLENTQNYRVGYLTIDHERGLVFMSHSRWIDQETTTWGASLLPQQKDPTKPMMYGSPCSMMFPLRMLEDVYFLEPPLWGPWLEKP